MEAPRTLPRGDSRLSGAREGDGWSEQGCGQAKNQNSSVDEAGSAFDLEEIFSHFNLNSRLRDSCYEW